MSGKSETSVRAIVAARIQRALTWQGANLSKDRTKALRYYRGEKFGNESEGRSQIVSRDVAEVVDGMMPSLLRPFVGGDEAVRFEPKGPEDEAAAAQATEYANHVWNVDNPGFRVFHDWVKDGLLARVGVVKVWWEDREETTREEYSGLTAEEVQVLRLDPAVEIVESYQEREGKPDAPGMDSYCATIRRKARSGRIHVRNLPPEEFLIDGEHVSLDEKPFCAHRCRRTVSDLVEMGYAREKIEALSGDDSGAFDAGYERQERGRPEQSVVGSDGALDDSQREVWVSECYLRLDEDGDGIAEYRKITVAGDQAELILENEEVDDHPFAAWSPYPVPHKFHGESAADKLLDVQLTKSAILRQMLDNLYLINNARTEVVEGKVNLDDFLSSRPGGYVRVKELGAMREIVVPPVFQNAFPALEYLDAVRENRTGQTKYNQGLDANSLNKTASGINAIMNAAMLRLELIARIFAETGVRRAFRLILRLVVRRQDKARVVRLRNQWIAIDPRAWNAEMDVGVSVGLGTGNKDQQLGHLMAVWEKQVQALQLQGGPMGPLVSLANLYETAAHIVRNAGLKSSQGFFMDPSLTPPPMPPPPPPPDPAVIELQAKLAVENRRLDADIALKLRKHEDEIALKHMELTLKYGAPPPTGPIGGMASGVPLGIAPVMQADPGAAVGPALASIAMPAPASAPPVAG